MRIENLLSPGLYSNGIKLRTEAAKAISAAEVTAMVTPGGLNPSAGVLAAFFSDCAAKLAGLYETTAPTVSSRTRVSATEVRIVFSEKMDTSVLPTAAAFASSGNTITDIKWLNDTTLVLIGTGFAVTETVSYTQPALNAIRDRSANKVASFSGALA